MKRTTNDWTRRDIVRVGAATLLPAWLGTQAPRRKRIAAIVTEYRWFSHADVIVGRILDGYSPNGVHRRPRTQIVSMYTHQVPKNDMSVELASRHGFTIYPTVAEALTLGGPALAVDGVLLIGEHGTYPVNELGQTLYPRFELFQQVIAVFRKSGRVVPLYFDKHFSYSWQQAKTMYDEARALGIPWLAGSSAPLEVRSPDLEIPYDDPLSEALAIGYGEPDAYGFHTLEVLQCMVERRRGGETGIARVEFVQGDAVWRWRDGEGRWSTPLLDAALARYPRLTPGRMEDNVKQPVLFKLTYRDGLRAAVYLLDGHVGSWSFAARNPDRPELYSTYVDDTRDQRSLPNFDGLVYCIEELFTAGKPMYPVERTLLTTGALAFCFKSLKSGGPLDTPELAIAYRAPLHTYYQKS